MKQIKRIQCGRINGKYYRTTQYTREKKNNQSWSGCATLIKEGGGMTQELLNKIQNKIKELEEQRDYQKQVVEGMTEELRQEKDKVERHFIKEQLMREKHNLHTLNYAIKLLKELIGG